MKYDHLVKYNGEYYPAGTDVPVDAPKKSESTDNISDGVLEADKNGGADTEETQEKAKQGRKVKES